MLCVNVLWGLAKKFIIQIIEIKWKQPLASFYFLFISYLISLRRLNKP